MADKYRIVAKPGLYWRNIVVECEYAPGQWMELQRFEKMTAWQTEASRIKEARRYIEMREAGNEVLETFEVRRPATDTPPLPPHCGRRSAEPSTEPGGSR